MFLFQAEEIVATEDESMSRHLPAATTTTTDDDDFDDDDDDDFDDEDEDVDVDGDDEGVVSELVRDVVFLALKSLFQKPILESDNNILFFFQIDIREPLNNLRLALEKKLSQDLSGYEFWLQDAQRLPSDTTLVDQCIQGEGLVQVRIDLELSFHHAN